MSINRPYLDSEDHALLADNRAELLDIREERELLERLAELRSRLESFAGDAHSSSRLRETLTARCEEIRGRLALANVRLVAHVARKFRDRGLSYSDLLQEGMCGLLEAIDRYDLGFGTKLATYATWWIRQAIQQAVAAGAYPVRLNPRHLRRLALNQEEAEADREVVDPSAKQSAESIRSIRTATRPALSIHEGLDAETDYNLSRAMAGDVEDQSEVDDRREAVGLLMESLLPREQEVIKLRFGLEGRPRLSLSQIGKVLEVSKERVRQIQERALSKLRSFGVEHGLGEAVALA